jgi:hypothetical protein
MTNDKHTTTKRMVTPEAIADLYRRCGAIDLAETVESSLSAMAAKSAEINDLVTAYRNDEPLIDVAADSSEAAPRSVDLRSKKS